MVGNCVLVEILYRQRIWNIFYFRMMNDYAIYLLNDQPTTCPICGVRTDFDEFTENNKLVQIHTCIYHEPCFTFLAMED